MHDFDCLAADLRHRLIDACSSEAQARVLYDQLIAEGARREHARVCGHLELGLASGDVAIAVKAIRSGAPVEGISNADTSAAEAGATQARASSATLLFGQTLAILKGQRASMTSKSGKSLMDQGLDILEARRGGIRKEVGQ